MDLIASNIGLYPLGSDGAGIIVVDRARRILFKNRVAESVLASNGALMECQQTLASRSAAVELRLRAAERGASARRERRRHLNRPTSCISRAPRVCPLLGLIVPLPASVAEDLGALLLFWDPQVMSVLPECMLRQLFGLTPAETLTALATYEGRTPAKIAESRKRSVNTVRTLLSRVFMKCGVTRQAELVRLLAAIGNVDSFAGPGEIRVTPPGQARYVGENVLHRGHNRGARGSVQVLLINVTQRGKGFRVDERGAFV